MDHREGRKQWNGLVSERLNRIDLNRVKGIGRTYVLRYILLLMKQR